MITYWLKEDKRLAKLPVVFSPEIIQSIENIYRRNNDNQEALAEWKNYINGVIGYISNPVIAWDNMGKFSHKPNGETYISEGDIEVGFTIKVDNTTHQSFIYVFRINFHSENYGLRESTIKKGSVIDEYGCCKSTLQIKPSNKIVVTESDIKNMILECVYRIISEATINGHTYPIEKQMGKWKCIDGIYWERELPDCPEKGLCYDIRMYDNTNVPQGEWETYALWRRLDNGRYFYTTIVPSPEGNSQTLWKTVPLSKVPQEILNDRQLLPLPPERVLANPPWHKSMGYPKKIKVYKKHCIDSNGEKWPDFMSDQDIQIQNDYMRRYKVTRASQLLPIALKSLSSTLGKSE